MATDPIAPDHTSSAHHTVPLIHEEVVVGKERIETGRVRIARQVKQEVQTVDVPVLREEVDVERVPLRQLIENVPPVRHEGDTMVIPVVREEVVVEKRLVLVEEIRITRKTTRAVESQDVTLRRDEIRIDRQPAGSEAQE